MNDPGLDDQIQENARDVARKYHENQSQQQQQRHRNSGHKHEKASRGGPRDEGFEEGMPEDGNVAKGFTQPGFVQLRSSTTCAFCLGLAVRG